LTFINAGTKSRPHIKRVRQAHENWKKIMACSKFYRLLISLVVLSDLASANAQSGGYTARPGGVYGTGGGTGVRTGRGPLSQPIPPATSLINPRQNYYYPQTPYRPQYYGGPAVTNPPQYPFGEGPQ
jgi:hypothetical protein